MPNRRSPSPKQAAHSLASFRRRYSHRGRARPGRHEAGCGSWRARRLPVVLMVVGSPAVRGAWADPGWPAKRGLPRATMKPPRCGSERHRAFVHDGFAIGDRPCETVHPWDTYRNRDQGGLSCPFTSPDSAAAWPLLIPRQRLPRWGLSTLNSMASGLAVYASPSELPQLDARLTSSCWSGSTGRAFHPQGSDERFQSCGLHLVPLSQALLGAMDVTCRTGGCVCPHRCA